MGEVLTVTADTLHHTRFKLHLTDQSPPALVIELAGNILTNIVCQIDMYPECLVFHLPPFGDARTVDDLPRVVFTIFAERYHYFTEKHLLFNARVIKYVNSQSCKPPQRRKLKSNTRTLRDSVTPTNPLNPLCVVCIVPVSREAQDTVDKLPETVIEDTHFGSISEAVTIIANVSQGR